jgi:hypothetical protein
LERLLTFESYLRIAITNGHQLTSAIYKYKDFLIAKLVEMSDVEENYCRKRLLKYGYNKAKGFLFYVKNDIKAEIDKNA